MQELDDSGLLRAYVELASEAAFAALIERHLNKVYSVALRHVANPHQAEEITQAVFIILARKSSGLLKHTCLSGWLYQTARLTSVTFVRSEIRRARREQEAYMQTGLNETESDAWRQIAPLLDGAIAGLGSKERDAIVLRFFDGKSMKDVGAALAVNEDAAKKRVNRAVEKLRKFFLKRGVVSTTAIIAGAMAANSVQAAPAALAKSVTAIAIAKGAAAGGSTLTLIQGALKIMAWTKAKTAIVVSAGVLLAAGTTTVTVKEIQEHRTYPWQVSAFDTRILEAAPPQVRIVPSKNPPGKGCGVSRRGKIMGLGQPIKLVVQAGYSFGRDTRFVFPTNLLSELPAGPYDFIASLPDGNWEALRQEIKRKFGVVANPQMRETDVLFLKVKRPGAPGLKPSRNRGGGQHLDRGRYTCVNVPLSSLTGYAEVFLNVPVIDRTGLSGNFDFDLIWDEQWDDQGRNIPSPFRQALLDQLGLELVPSREPIEMLVVEKVK